MSFLAIYILKRSRWVSIEEGAEVELFTWKDAQFLDSDRHWKIRKIKEH